MEANKTPKGGKPHSFAKDKKTYAHQSQKNHPRNNTAPSSAPDPSNDAGSRLRELSKELTGRLDDFFPSQREQKPQRIKSEWEVLAVSDDEGENAGAVSHRTSSSQQNTGKNKVPPTKQHQQNKPQKTDSTPKQKNPESQKTHAKNVSSDSTSSVSHRPPGAAHNTPKQQRQGAAPESASGKLSANDIPNPGQINPGQIPTGKAKHGAAQYEKSSRQPQQAPHSQQRHIGGPQPMSGQQPVYGPQRLQQAAPYGLQPQSHADMVTQMRSHYGDYLTKLGYKPVHESGNVPYYTIHNGQIHHHDPGAAQPHHSDRQHNKQQPAHTPHHASQQHAQHHKQQHAPQQHNHHNNHNSHHYNQAYMPHNAPTPPQTQRLAATGVPLPLPQHQASPTPSVNISTNASASISASSSANASANASKPTGKAAGQAAVHAAEQGPAPATPATASKTTKPAKASGSEPSQAGGGRGTVPDQTNHSKKHSDDNKAAATAANAGASKKQTNAAKSQKNPPTDGVKQQSMQVRDYEDSLGLPSWGSFSAKTPSTTQQAVVSESFNGIFVGGVPLPENLLPMSNALGTAVETAWKNADKPHIREKILREMDLPSLERGSEAKKQAQSQGYEDDQDGEEDEDDENAEFFEYCCQQMGLQNWDNSKKSSTSDENAVPSKPVLEAAQDTSKKTTADSKAAPEATPKATVKKTNAADAQETTKKAAEKETDVPVDKTLAKATPTATKATPAASKVTPAATKASNTANKAATATKNTKSDDDDIFFDPDMPALVHVDTGEMFDRHHRMPKKGEIKKPTTPTPAAGKSQIPEALDPDMPALIDVDSGEIATSSSVAKANEKPSVDANPSTGSNTSHVQTKSQGGNADGEFLYADHLSDASQVVVTGKACEGYEKPLYANTGEVATCLEDNSFFCGVCLRPRCPYGENEHYPDYRPLSRPRLPVQEFDPQNKLGLNGSRLSAVVHRLTTRYLPLLEYKGDVKTPSGLATMRQLLADFFTGVDTTTTFRAPLMDIPANAAFAKLETRGGKLLGPSAPRQTSVPLSLHHHIYEHLTCEATWKKFQPTARTLDPKLRRIGFTMFEFDVLEYYKKMELSLGSLSQGLTFYRCDAVSASNAHLRGHTGDAHQSNHGDISLSSQTDLSEPSHDDKAASAPLSDTLGATYLYHELAPVEVHVLAVQHRSVRLPDVVISTGPYIPAHTALFDDVANHLKYNYNECQFDLDMVCWSVPPASLPFDLTLRSKLAGMTNWCGTFNESDPTTRQDGTIHIPKHQPSLRTDLIAQVCANPVERLYIARTISHLMHICNQRASVGDRSGLLHSYLAQFHPFILLNLSLHALIVKALLNGFPEVALAFALILAQYHGGLEATMVKALIVAKQIRDAEYLKQSATYPQDFIDLTFFQKNHKIVDPMDRLVRQNMRFEEESDTEAVMQWKTHERIRVVPTPIAPFLRGQFSVCDPVHVYAVFNIMRQRTEDYDPKDYHSTRVTSKYPLLHYERCHRQVKCYSALQGLFSFRIFSLMVRMFPSITRIACQFSLHVGAQPPEHYAFRAYEAAGEAGDGTLTIYPLKPAQQAIATAAQALVVHLATRLPAHMTSIGYSAIYSLLSFGACVEHPLYSLSAKTPITAVEPLIAAKRFDIISLLLQSSYRHDTPPFIIYSDAAARVREDVTETLGGEHIYAYVQRQVARLHSLAGVCDDDGIFAMIAVSIALYTDMFAHGCPQVSRDWVGYITPSELDPAAIVKRLSDKPHYCVYRDIFNDSTLMRAARASARLPVLLALKNPAAVAFSSPERGNAVITALDNDQHFHAQALQTRLQGMEDLALLYYRYQHGRCALHHAFASCSPSVLAIAYAALCSSETRRFPRMTAVIDSKQDDVLLYAPLNVRDDDDNTPLHLTQMSKTMHEIYANAVRSGALHSEPDKELDEVTRLMRSALEEHHSKRDVPAFEYWSYFPEAGFFTPEYSERRKPNMAYSWSHENVKAAVSALPTDMLDRVFASFTNHLLCLLSASSYTLQQLSTLLRACNKSGTSVAIRLIHQAPAVLAAIVKYWIALCQYNRDLKIHAPEFSKPAEEPFFTQFPPPWLTSDTFLTAVAAGTSTLVAALLAARADVDSCDEQGRSALAIAAAMDRPHTMRVLIQHGAVAGPRLQDCVHRVLARWDELKTANLREYLSKVGENDMPLDPELFKIYCTRQVTLPNSNSAADKSADKAKKSTSVGRVEVVHTLACKESVLSDPSTIPNTINSTKPIGATGTARGNYANGSADYPLRGLIQKMMQLGFIG